MRFVHRRNVIAITPHPSLMHVHGAACAAMAGETIDAAYLRCGIQAAAARAADIVEVQAQFLETDPMPTSGSSQMRRRRPGSRAPACR